MDKTQFWSLIEASQNKKGNCEKQAKKLKTLLLKLDANEIVEFNRIFVELERESYRWDLWGTAYIINGGASDDGFTYFRWWLIAQGQAYFETALENPERAGDQAKEGQEVECEDIAYCINDAYKEKTGENLPPRPATLDYPPEPKGTRWEEDLETLFPALCEKFG